MGNCMERSSETDRWQAEEKEEVKQHQVEKDEGKKRVRVKVVLTKEELQWLILQLNQKQGMGLDQVLEEIKRSRDKLVQPWKPSLESILEIPEVPPQMDR
ncbi:uncharacterized protein LOC129284562 [Prosopis cineraria]|uniref:uncharacterized protein LOC129284562 n=1 Tax=Prosopis cineraria TaxID=364024 RepID=UPI00240EF3E2|nr:uncharacterized protein LOC129284562 [Prosopis cineraria]